MRALLLPLALLAGLAAAAPAMALPVDCDAPSNHATWATCYEFWVAVDPGHCLRQEDPALCFAMMEFSCTLDAPPSRCGSAMAGFGFRGPG